MTKCMTKTPAKFEDAVSKTGFGWFNLYLLFVGGGCLMSVIMETMGMMFVMPAAECDLDLTLTTKGLLASISFVGVVSSSHLWGYLADTRGRRAVLLISMCMGITTSIISSLMPTAWAFILIRYFNGFFIGGSSAIIYAYVGEFHDAVYRPKVITWIATFVALGNVALPSLSWIILPLDFGFHIPVLDLNYRPWRLLVVAFGCSSMIFGICLYNLPESPKFLLTLGKNEEALRILRRIFSANTGKAPEEFPVSEIIWEEADDNIDSKKCGMLRSIWMQTVPLFKNPYLPKTFMVCLLQFGTFVSSSGLFMWYPEILNRMAAYSNDSSVCEAIDFYNANQNARDAIGENCSDVIDEEVYKLTIFMGVALALLYIVTGTIIHVVGSKNLVISVMVVTTCAGLAAQFVYGNTLAQVLIGIFLMVGICIGIINTIVIELYPTQLRGMALAISLMAGRFGAVAGSHMAGFLMYKLCDYTFYIYGLDHLVLIVTIFLLPTSRRAQKLLEPIT